MPAKKKMPSKKSAKVSANFTANVPEAMISECCKPKKIYRKGGSAGALYFFGFIGAAIYFIGAAATFRMGVLGFLKALVRPVFLVHGLLKYLGL